MQQELLDTRRSRGRTLAAIFFATVLTLLAVPASAQDTGIIGQVKDESGGVLPGVTVTATSPALQVGTMTTVTDASGEYRLAPLPIGSYVVTYELTGFRGVKREDVRLTTGFVAKMDAILSLGALGETVMVSGASPVVDVASTSTSTRLTKEMLETIPTARTGVTSMMALAPGVRPLLDIGGSSGINTPQFRAFGQSGETWQSVEGVTSASARSGATGNYFDFSGVEEVNVKTVGANADMPFRGIQLESFVKSGGNDFHGTVYQTFSNQSFLGDNLTPELKALGITAAGDLLIRRDTSLDLGGRLIRDKLWFYVGMNRQKYDANLIDCFQEDGKTPCHRLQAANYENYKLSYQATKSNRFIFFLQKGLKNDFGSGSSQLIPWETRWNQYLYVFTGKVEHQASFGDSLVTSVQLGRWYYDGPYFGYTDKVATLETTTGARTGRQFSSQVGWWGGAYVWHPKATATLYKPDFFLGNHEFKAGADYIDSDLSRRVWPTSVLSPEHGIDITAPDYQLQFTNGVPTQMLIKNSPVVPHTLSKYLGLYLQDNWTIARRVTLNLGLRFAHDNSYVPEQCREASPEFPTLFPAECYQEVQFKIYNTFAPRIHLAWDVMGDAKTVVKGGWSRFDERRISEPEVTAATQNFPREVLFRWRDLNSDKQYQPGEVNLDRNGPDYLSTTPLSNGVPNLTNEKQPKSDEFMLSVEREILPNTALRVTGIYSRNFNTKALDNVLRPFSVYNIPITNRDPGPDGVLNNGDDPGTNFTYFDYPSSYRGVNFERTMPINVPDLDASFKSYEIAASRRLSSRWQMLASFSSTRIDQPAPRLPAYNPNSFLNVADNTTEWSGKLSGSYQFPAQVVASAFYEARSGNYWARTVQFRGGGSIPQLVVNVEPTSSRQLPNNSHLDLRVDKKIRMPKGQTLSVRLNAYNILNAATVLNVNPRSGTSFGRPTAIMPARVLEIGATYSF